MTWTDETYRIHGYSPDQYPQGSADLMQHSLKCYDPEDRPVIEEAFHQCAVEGRPYDLTVPFTKADGRRLWIRTIGIPIRDQEKIIKVIGNIVDVTDQKQMTNVLQARLRLREAAAMLPLEKLLQKFLDEAEILTGSFIGFFIFLRRTAKRYPCKPGRATPSGFARQRGKNFTTIWTHPVSGRIASGKGDQLSTTTTPRFRTAGGCLPVMHR
jgi:PAS domain S-box-containing protein